MRYRFSIQIAERRATVLTCVYPQPLPVQRAEVEQRALGRQFRALLQVLPVEVKQLRRRGQDGRRLGPSRDVERRARLSPAVRREHVRERPARVSRCARKPRGAHLSCASTNTPMCGSKADESVLGACTGYVMTLSTSMTGTLYFLLTNASKSRTCCRDSRSSVTVSVGAAFCSTPTRSSLPRSVNRAIAARGRLTASARRTWRIGVGLLPKIRDIRTSAPPRR